MLTSGRVCGIKKFDIHNALSAEYQQMTERLRRIWQGIKTRCYNPGHNTYKYYGKRKIGMCAEWADFKTFRSWALTNGYAPNLTIERKDNDKDYSPDNCKWATWKEQAQNRRKRRKIEPVRRYNKIKVLPMANELKLVYIRIYQEDFDLLQALFTDSIGYNAAIREIVKAHCDKLREKMEASGVKSTDFGRSRVQVESGN